MIYEAITRGIAGLIGIFSPGSAAQYLRGHTALRQYDAGKNIGVDRRFNPQTKTGDREIGEDWRKATDKARDILRNNGFMANSQRIATAFTVGTSIWPKPRVKDANGTVDKIISKTIFNSFCDWAEVCCVNGQDWDYVKKMAFKHMKSDGEVVIHEASTDLHPFQLEVLEPDQIDSTVDDFGGSVPNGRAPGNRCVRGIEFNRFGRPVAYWLLDAHPGDTIFGTKSRRVPADQIYHIFDPNRATETRGICDFVSSIIPSFSHQQHRFAVMDLLRIAAAYGIFIESEYPEDFFEEPTVEKPSTQDEKKLYSPKAYVTPAGIHVLRKGEKISHAKPEQPTAAFKDVEQSHLRMAAAGAGMSFETFTGDLSNVNYSSLRAGQVNERALFRMTTDLIIRKFAGRAYSRWMDVEVLRKALLLPGYWNQKKKYQEVSWSLPGFPSTDQLKDETADSIALANGTTSRRIICERKGIDFDDLADELEYENNLLLGKGITPNSSTPVDPALVAALINDEKKPESDPLEKKDEKQGDKDVGSKK
jgi:lambda family phage portal protein